MKLLGGNLLVWNGGPHTGSPRWLLVLVSLFFLILWLSTQPCLNETFLPGIAIDLLVYSIIIPVIPFQLESIGYTGVSALAGWLLFAYVG